MTTLMSRQKVMDDLGTAFLLQANDQNGDKPTYECVCYVCMYGYQ